MTIKICLAGATGWAGSELARGFAAEPGVHHELQSVLDA